MSINKQYTMISVMPQGAAQLEDLINEKAAEGYRPVYFWDLHTKLIVVLEFRGNNRPGRPRKEEEPIAIGE